MVIFEKMESVRKVIVSTNIAEASVTIENIVYVIDCLHVKIKYTDTLRSIIKIFIILILKLIIIILNFIYFKDIDKLEVIPVSKA